jgi:hypothetical protein
MCIWYESFSRFLGVPLFFGSNADLINFSSSSVGLSRMMLPAFPCTFFLRASRRSISASVSVSQVSHLLGPTIFKSSEKEGIMKRVCALIVCLAFLGVASAKDGGEKEARNLFEFNRLTAVVPPFTGAANPIRGIGGGGRHGRSLPEERS